MSFSAKQSTSQQGRDLTIGSIPRHLIAFSLPMLAGSLLQTAYSFVNAIWVGKYLGVDQLAAITVSFPVLFVLIALGAGLTLATNILISQHFGARRYGEIRKVVDSSTVLIGLGSIVLLVIGELLAPSIIRAMDTPLVVQKIAIDYLRIFLLSLPAGFGLFLTRNMLQGIGDSKTPLYFQTGSVLLTAVLDPLLMLGWLGFPKLGLNGTAWASGFSQILAVIALLVYMHRKQSPVSPAWSHLCVEAETVWITVKIGIPSAIQQSLVSIGSVVVISVVNGFGEVATAAFGAASRIDLLAFMPAMTFSMAIATLAGQNIGAQKYHRVREIFLWGLLLSGGFTLIASALALTIPQALLRIFVSEANVIDLGTSYLRVVGASYIFFAFVFVSNGVINGAGRTFMTTIVSLVSLWLVRVPLAYFLSHRMHSVTGVWYALAISFFASMLVSYGYYLSGHWKTPILGKAPPMTETAIFADEVSEA